RHAPQVSARRGGSFAHARARRRRCLSTGICSHRFGYLLNLVGAADPHHHIERRPLPAITHSALSAHEEMGRQAYNFLMTAPDPLLRYRSEFPILEKTTYLISNSLGAMPRGVFESMHEDRKSVV